MNCGPDFSALLLAAVPLILTSVKALTLVYTSTLAKDFELYPRVLLLISIVQL